MAEVTDLTTNQIRLLTKAFSAFEIEEKKTIPINELETILEMLGCAQTPDMIHQLHKEFDPKRLGELNFDVFKQIAARFLPDEENPEQMQQELREAFRLYDKEGNGYITTIIMREILAELDDTLTSEDLDGIIDEIDADGSGTVDFEGNGYITTDVLREIFKELDDTMTEDDINLMIDEIDQDGSGTVDFDEFMEVMTGGDD